MMKIYLGYEYGAGNSKPVFDAFRNGIMDHNCVVVDNFRDADVCVIWSILFVGRMAGNERIWKHCLKHKVPCIVLEVGALDRGNSWKVGINGINNVATWCTPWQENRLENKFSKELKPWKNDGEFITIMMQRTDSFQWFGMPTAEEWLVSTINDIRDYSDRPIVVRPHPRQHQMSFSFLNSFKDIYLDVPKHVGGTYDSFNHGDIFSRSHTIVNHSSGPGVQSSLDGIPALVSHDSLAWDVSIKTPQFIENWQPVDRTDWANKLAHTEFFIDEIASGEVFGHLKTLL